MSPAAVANAASLRIGLRRDAEGLEAAPGVLEPEAGEELVGERDVVLAEVGPVVEDRDAALGGLGVGDRLADRGLEDLVRELLAERLIRITRVDRPHVGDVEDDAEPFEVR